MVYLTDKEIERLIAETKPLPKDYRSLLKAKPKRNFSHEEGHLEVETPTGSRYKIILRRSLVNMLDFSIILTCFHKSSGKWLRLVRYNGKHSEHTNMIERNKFYDFHIHRATERYQTAGFPIDGYAEICREYSDYRSALSLFLQDLNFQTPHSDQMEFFSGL